MSKLKLGINPYVSNEEYHADREYLSSSAFKLLLKSAKEFEAKYILEQPEEEKAENLAFSEGSLTHAYILEPEVVEQEFAFFPGFRKQGKEFQEFKAKNRGKTIISASQEKRCKEYVQAYNNLPAAVNLISGGIAEHTVCGLLSGISVKVRTDYINVDKGYIADIKTTAWASDRYTFIDTIARYGYDLSAALYAEVVKQYYDKDFDFYFIVISKKEKTCDVYKMSDKSYKKGLDSLMNSVSKYKQCKRTGIWRDEMDLKRESLEDDNYEILEV